MKNTVKNIIDKLEDKFPQINMSGCNNIWILKPSNSSRGRDIHCFSNLEEILY